MTACNLNKHIKTVHMKMKTMCQICDLEMPLSRISHHRRTAHNIGQPKEVVIPRALKLKKLKSLLKVQHRQAEEDDISTLLQEQVPVEMECEENEEGDPIQVIKKEFPQEKGREYLDINGNNSHLEESTNSGYRHEFEVFAGDQMEVGQ